MCAGDGCMFMRMALVMVWGFEQPLLFYMYIFHNYNPVQQSELFVGGKRLCFETVICPDIPEVQLFS